MDIFDISNFNVIQDEENYYFFRALNRGDNADIEQGITSSNGAVTRVRTDRERWEEVEENPEPKYGEAVELSLEQMYDHIKVRQRKDTNCISLSSNANVSISYGRAYYKDQYVIVRVPKAELGEKVKVAGQYMLSEIERRVQEEVARLEGGAHRGLVDVVQQIDRATSTDEIIDSVFKGYSLSSEEKVYTATNGKKIATSNLKGRFSSYQTLSEEQNLAKNRLFAKLTLLEYFAGMERIIPHTATNSNLLATVGGAISSLELINYGDIEQESIIKVPSKIMDMLALLQQASEKIDVENESREEIERKQRLISEIESRLISHARSGYDIEVRGEELVFTDGTNSINVGISAGKSILDSSDNYVEPTIAEMYELTNGEVEYANMKTLLEKNYYVSRAKLRANEFAEIINEIFGNNPEYEDIIELIKSECFEIEPVITTRTSRGGYKLSESVSVEFSQSEISLIDTIKNSTLEELKSNIETTTKESVERCIAHINERTSIDKNTYYAKALIASYDFDSMGINFTPAQKELFLQKLQEYDLPTLYEAAKNAGVREIDISKVLLNLCMNSQIDKVEITESVIRENIETLQENLYIEQIEDFLGFYNIEGTDIKLKEYQQRASNKLDEIYEDKRFASVILPTGAGKSFVAMAEMLKERYHLRDKENASKMLYLAPSHEILNQIQDYLIKYVIGTKGTLGKTREEIIKEAFPNLELATYASLKHRGKKRLENDKYDLIILDELHRTGAKEWGKYLDKVLESQDENVRVLGITATPERDVDGRNMTDEIAIKMGYSEEEVAERKHVAMKMDLMDAIRNGIVVDPKVVSCEYNLQENERFINLLEEINQIENEELRKEKLAKYEELRRSIENAAGVSEILGNNLKNCGKYIVFIPVNDEEEIEDEFGNKILNKLSAEEKIKKAEAQLKEWIKTTGKSAKFYSMLGAYSDRENAEQLASFETDDGQEIKFMLVINKLNEGVHLKNVDGIVWMRALDRNSKILLLQQMGRCIYALDENNPIPEELLPLIIDLPNNLMTVDMQKEINNYTSTDDLAMLQDILEWIKFHNDHLPDIESKGREEQRKAITLKRIQQKYLKYLSSDLSKIDEEELTKIQQILEIGEEIDLWNLELPDKKGKDGSVVSIEELTNIDVFNLEGKLGRLCELEDEVKKINSLKRTTRLIKELEEWCYENFGDDENPKCKRYERHLPRFLLGVQTAKKGEKETNDQREYRLRYSIDNSPLIKRYRRDEEIPDEARNLIERYKKLEEMYGGKPSVKRLEKVVVELEEWCYENFGDDENPKCKKYERHMPKLLRGVRNITESNLEEKERREYSIARDINGSSLIKRYKSGESIPDEAKELIEKYIKLEEMYSGNSTVITLEKLVTEFEEWCCENFGDDENPKCKKHERHMPRQLKGVGIPMKGEEETKEQREWRLAYSINNNSLIKRYKRDEDIPDEARELIEKYIKLEEAYRGNTLVGNLEKIVVELEAWCYENFGDDENLKCKRCERHMPRLLKSMRSPIEKSVDEKEQREFHLASSINANSLIRSYKKGEEIPEEAKELIERYKKLEEMYSGNPLVTTLDKLVTELEIWCYESFGDDDNLKCKRYKRHMPRYIEGTRAPKEGEEESKEQKEYRLASAIDANKLIKKYKKGEDIPEEARKLIERYVKLEELYTGNKLIVNLEKLVIETEKWCYENFGDDKNPKFKRCETYMPRYDSRVRGAKEGEKETEEQKEVRLANSIRANLLIKRYKNGEEIPEEAQELIDRYIRLEEMYMSEKQRKRKSKLRGEEIGKSTYGASTPQCAEMAAVVDGLMQEREIGGEVDSE